MVIMTKIQSIAIKDRDMVLPLLNLRSASDAIFAYYALEHPENLVELYVNYSVDDRPSGFLVSAKTGYDLFRPLVLPAVGSESAMVELLRSFLSQPMPILIQVPLEQRDWIEKVLVLQNIHVTELLRLEPAAFEPILNVLVVESKTPESLPRFEIRSKSGARAIAGVNWKGNRFAEVYVDADQEGVERNFALSVLASVCSNLVDQNLTPLFQNEKSVLDHEQLDKLGFRSTGTRYLFAHAELKSSAI
jgi:hypothetical protein